MVNSTFEMHFNFSFSKKSLCFKSYKEFPILFFIPYEIVQSVKIEVGYIYFSHF